jgi:hypothetical protein
MKPPCALRLLSAMGHRNHQRTEAMLHAVERGSHEWTFDVLVCLHNHAAVVLDILAGESSPQRDQYLADLDARTDRMAAQHAAVGRAGVDPS